MLKGWKSRTPIQVRFMNYIVIIILNYNMFHNTTQYDAMRPFALREPRTHAHILKWYVKINSLPWHPPLVRKA